MQLTYIILATYAIVYAVYIMSIYYVYIACNYIPFCCEITM